MLSDVGLCDELIVRPEKSYQVWRVVLCVLETCRMRRPGLAVGSSGTDRYMVLSAGCSFIANSCTALHCQWTVNGQCNWPFGRIIRAANCAVDNINSCTALHCQWTVNGQCNWPFGRIIRSANCAVDNINISSFRKVICEGTWRGCAVWRVIEIHDVIFWLVCIRCSGLLVHMYGGYES